MKITEEIDAMRTIGVSPIEALVIPRMIAAVVMMPLLSFYAMLMSLLGGGIYVWADLGIPPLTFIQRLQGIDVLDAHNRVNPVARRGNRIKGNGKQRILKRPPIQLGGRDG